MKKNLLLRAAAAAAAYLTASALSCICAATEYEPYTPEDSQEIQIYESGDYTYSVVHKADDETFRAARIETYIGQDTEPVIPETLDGLPVVALGDKAFRSNHLVTAVTLPKSLTILGTYSFAECDSLTEYRVAEGCTCFEAVDGILFSEDRTYLVRYPVGRRPTSYTVPEGVYDIGCSAFAYCGTLESITLPSSLTAIGETAFAGCSALKQIDIPSGVTLIEQFTFYRCSGLQSVTIPEGVTEIGKAAFACTALSTVKLPDSLQYVGEAAFADTPMMAVTIPSLVSEIGYSAFGWKLNSNNELTAIEGFTIYGSGSGAAAYAQDEENGDAFIYISQSTDAATSSDSVITTSAATSSSSEQGIGTGRLIGIIACCAALAAILIAAVLSFIRGKSKKKQNSGAGSGKEDGEVQE